MLAVSTAMVLVGVGCGGDDGGAASSGAGDTTTSSTSTTLDTERGGVADLRRIVAAAENTTDEGTARYTLSVATAETGLSDGEQPIEVEGEVDFEQERRRLIFTADTGASEVLVDGTELYIEMPATEDETWARLDLDELVDAEVGFGGIEGLPFQNPQDNLESLRSSATRVEISTDEEDVDGASTTQYTVFLDLEQVAGETDDDTGEAIEEGVDQTGITEFEMNVWIDDDDLIRRIAYVVDLDQADRQEADAEGSTAEVDPAGQVTVTIDFTDFGADLTIDLPDEDAVVDLDEAELRRIFEDLGDSTSGTGSGTGAGGTTTTTADDDDDDDEGGVTTTTRG
jgi:hypothetical protein